MYSDGLVDGIWEVLMKEPNLAFYSKRRLLE